MSIGDESTLVSTVMLDSEDQMYSNLLVIVGWSSRVPIVFERIVVVQLGHLEFRGVLPFRVPCLLI